MKLLVIGLAALVLLGGGAAGAYFYFGQSAEASAPELEEHAKHAKKEKKKEKDGHAGSSVSFVRMDPLVLPIIDDQGVSQVISLVIVLEVKDQYLATEVRRMSPRLKDAYIQDMYGVLNRHAALDGGVLKVAEIKNRLNRISQNVMGDDVVKDVLLEVVQQRPI